MKKFEISVMGKITRYATYEIKAPNKKQAKEKAVRLMDLDFENFNFDSIKISSVVELVEAWEPEVKNA